MFRFSCSGIYDTYKVLLEVYKNELAKDAEYDRYLNKLGVIYFNVKPRQTGGFLGNLLQQFLQESDEEEESTPSNSATAPPPPSQPHHQPGPSSFGLPTLPNLPNSFFEQICQPRTAPRPSEPQHEDLD